MARALALLSRLPVGGDGARMAQSAWAWPLVGLLLGGAAAALGWLALAIGLPPWSVAGLCLGLLVLLTGAMHEDGLADCADGFWGGWTRERRLEIMRDSAIGAYGTLALILSIGLRWSALAALAGVGAGALAVGLSLSAMVSRVAMAALMAWLPAARQDGLAASVGAPPWRAVGLGAALALLVVLALAPGAVVWLALTLALVTIGWGAVARRKIGGRTGDVLGAGQQLCEIAALLTISACFTA